MKKEDRHDVHAEKNEIERSTSDLQMIELDAKVKDRQVYSNHVQLVSLSLPSSWVSSSFGDHGGWSSCLQAHPPLALVKSLCPVP